MKQGLADAFTTIVTILEAVAKKDPGFEIVGDFLTSEPIGFGVRENDFEVARRAQLRAPGHGRRRHLQGDLRASLLLPLPAASNLGPVTA